MQRRKGAAFERLCVRRAKKWKLASVRTAPMQANGCEGKRYCDFMVDVWYCEGKHHRRVSVNSFAGWTDRARHALIWRDNGKRIKATIDYEEFLDLVAAWRRA